MTKTGSTIAALQALLAVGVLLGLNLTEDQLAGIIVAANAVVLSAHAWASPSVPWFGKTEPAS